MPKNRLIPAVGLAIVALASIRTWGQPAGSPASGTAPSSLPAVPTEFPKPDAAKAEAPRPDAAKAEAPTPEPPTEAELFLDEAIKTIQKLGSISAEIVENVDMLNQKFQIKGRYRKAPKDRLYLKLEVSGLPDASGTMLQVCNGSTFWEYQKVFETQIYRRLEAGAILAKLRESDLDESFRQSVITRLGFAGPDVLLAGLRKVIKFDQKEKGTLDGRAVWKLRGTWTSHDGIFGPNSQPLPPLAPLPPYVPSLVTIYLGADDSWPYKITLVGQRLSVMFEDTRPIGPDGRRLGSFKSIQKPLLSKIDLTYSDVKLNAPVAETEFVFQAPAGAQILDETKEILDMLEQAATVRAAQKKAEAAKSEDAVLNQSINVPKIAPPADAPPPISKEPRLPK